ncbi:MAG: MnhB domain-containing protein, partial [Pseudomonadota bacterium]|nr:MnhB domain-containing protein [Pseudomonadota bacterium]
MNHHLVIRVVSKLLIPFILLFGLYVQFHGDFGPGGGFQAGVIFASAFILYALIFGVKDAGAVLPRGILRFGI